MPLIADLTLSQLRAATKAQIITGISNYLANLSKRQIILFLMDRDVIPDAPILSHRPDGQLTTQVDVNRDAETGTMIDGRQITWTYYPTGEVDTITISTRDATDKEIAKKIIKHFTDGRAPVVTQEKL
jgi:hypothetical protein